MQQKPAQSRSLYCIILTPTLKIFMLWKLLALLSQKMEPAVSATLLKQLLTGFKFDPEFSKNLEFDDFVEQQSLPFCMNHNQKEEDTD